MQNVDTQKHKKLNELNERICFIWEKRIRNIGVSKIYDPSFWYPKYVKINV